MILAIAITALLLSAWAVFASWQNTKSVEEIIKAMNGLKEIIQTIDKH